VTRFGLIQSCAVSIVVVVLVGCGTSGSAREVPSNMCPTTSPYAGRSSSSVPSLTTQEVDDLLAGRGLGLARAAELNGYPGPRHVLDLQSELELDAEVIAKTEELFKEMQAAAKPLGTQVVALEKELGDLYASRSIDEPMLLQKVDALAALMGQLRVIHLRTHIRMTALLTADQIASYQRLRGYVSAGSEVAMEAEAQPAAGSAADAHSAHHAK
jgi:Spy/CpxP family protein refolding chaperone